jgi:UPF0755 protein
MRRWVVAASIVVTVPLLTLFVILGRSVGHAGSFLVERSQRGVASVVDLAHKASDFPDPSLVATVVRAGFRLTGGSLTPGLYNVAEGSTQWDVVRMILRGEREPLVKLTVPEGFTMFQIASRLKHRASIDSAAFIAWCRSASSRTRYNVKSPTMDGFLMPATYTVIRTESAGAIATIMAEAALTSWRSLLVDNIRSRDSIVTLASIIQKEAVREDEYTTIAGVYANRLQRSMRLEADPTLQYGRDLAITRSDLRDASNPYNTYQHAGLPPGPIGNPGVRAMRAALNPERHEYVFFVARGDGTRGHRFARSYAEHLGNVRLYRSAKSQSSSLR